MSEISDTQFTAMMSLPAPERYSYSVRQIVACEELWTLRNVDGIVLQTNDEDGGEVVPIWPDWRFAAASAASGWGDSEPFRIDLDRWLAAWTPSIETDGRKVAVFPRADDQGIVVTAGQLSTDLGLQYG